MARKERRPPGPATPRDWKARYLVHVRKHGHYALAAHNLGLSPRTAERERTRDPEFDADCRDAKEIAADGMEIDMLELAQTSGNPVPYIVRLKALRPHEYIEKHALMTVNVHAELAGHDAGALLAEMLAHMSPATHQLFTQGPTQTALPERADG